MNRRNFLKITATATLAAAAPVAFGKELLKDPVFGSGPGEIIGVQEFTPIMVCTGDSIQFIWTFVGGAIEVVMDYQKSVAVSKATITEKEDGLWFTAFDQKGEVGSTKVVIKPRAI